MQRFSNNLPHLVDEANEQPRLRCRTELNKNGIHVALVKQGKTALQTIQDKVAKSAGKLASFGAGLLNEAASAVFDLVLIFVLSVYMLLYGERSARSCEDVMPRATARTPTTTRTSCRGPSRATSAASCCSA